MERAAVTLSGRNRKVGSSSLPEGVFLKGSVAQSGRVLEFQRNGKTDILPDSAIE